MSMSADSIAIDTVAMFDHSPLSASQKSYENESVPTNPGSGL